MTVGLAQVRSEAGRVARNVEHHLGVLRSLPASVDLVVFPELSLTNYAPEAARAALDPDDARLRPLQAFADAAGTTVAVGAPTRAAGLPHISLLVVRPGRPRTALPKQHLHPDEAPAFAAGRPAPPVLDVAGARLGVAICYEVAVRSHTEAVAAEAPDAYLASVAKTARGVAEAEAALADIARRLGAPALLVNSVGTCEGERAGGGSFALDARGRPLARLGADEEGVLLVDLASGAATAERLRGNA